MKYRKKPIIVDAMQFDGKNLHEIELWVIELGYEIDSDEDVGLSFDLRGAGNHIYLNIYGDKKTVICRGEWIIRDIKGEIYPCKPDIFEATYEKVES